MNISKQIIDQRINVLMNDNPTYFEGQDFEIRRSKFFLLLGVSAYLDIDISEAYTFITDGSNDGGFDAAYIEETTDTQINVILFQSKYVRDLSKDSNFPANAIEKAVHSVNTVLDPSVATTLTEFSQRIVDEIHSFVLDGKIPYVTFVMINNGMRWNEGAQSIIDNAFGGQEQVRFEHFSHDAILGYIQRVKPINTQIKLSGVAIQENFNYMRVIVGKINISEINTLMEENGDKLLERNIRKYLGRNEINDNISATLEGDKSANFFFYNNGITMICDKFAYNALQEKDWIVKVDGLQIINGGQTCKTIFQTLKEKPDISTEDVYVLVRIYEISNDENIVSEITYATNHQNPVDLRDLKSNDEYQKLLEKGIKDLGYDYKRKREGGSSAGMIPVTVAAEAVFSVWRKMPHLARYKKSELFGDYYEHIFKDLNAAQLILAVLIFRASDNNRKKISSNEDFEYVKSYSNHFIACIVGEKILRDLNLTLPELTHREFERARMHFESSKEALLSFAERMIIDILYDYFHVTKEEGLVGIDGRTMAAAFRRFDILERYIKNDAYWQRFDGE